MDFMSFLVLLKNRLSCSELVPCKMVRVNWSVLFSRQLTRKNPASAISPPLTAGCQVERSGDTEKTSQRLEKSPSTRSVAHLL